MNPSLSFYVASKFERKTQVKALMEELRARSHTILGDWTGHTVEGIADPKRRANMLTAFAVEDLRAVLRCEVFVLLHDDHCRGGFSELGIALAAGCGGFVPKRIFVIGGETRSPENGPIFYHCPQVEHFGSVGEFLNYIDRGGLNRKD